MKTIRIVGVPEHFNLPWLMAIEEGAFEKQGIDLIWTDVPEGTGKMSSMLMTDEADMAVILTEGIIRSIIEGNPCKIIQEYIASPLFWGIHVGAKSNFQELNELNGKIAAISRYGSGSHLMSYVNAENESWDLENLKFNVINTIDGAVVSLTSGTSDYFLWERFTTKPLVDKGIFRHLGDCPTPWPCFVIAASDKSLKKNDAIIKTILEIINNYTAEFKSIPSINKTLSNQYQQELEDINSWLQLTEWSQAQISKKTVEKVQETLKNLNLIPHKFGLEEILTNL
ncbi:MAG: substrate-binding domain-containing protein [Eudoraea sp.]|uniref:substrate-binding domain-containing protein n=1 Tax=Eudoraea sp. TaxID=1979955 RepID=UPI003C715D21